MKKAVSLSLVLFLAACASLRRDVPEPLAPPLDLALLDTVEVEPVEVPEPEERWSEEMVLRQLVDSAMVALGPGVTEQSHPDALRYALKAYYQFRMTHPYRVRNPYFYYVDFGLDAATPRGYFFDMESMRLVEGPFTVAHGRGSVRPGESLPTRFSNVRGSLATSLGLYVAQETYGFRGTSGGRPYRSIGLRLDGVSGTFNSAARVRGIVVHGAPYVTERVAGRSEGCPAMEQERADRLLPRLANGGVVFHFSPFDPRWMATDPWASAGQIRYAAAE